MGSMERTYHVRINEDDLLDIDRFAYAKNLSRSESWRYVLNCFFDTYPTGVPDYIMEDKDLIDEHKWGFENQRNKSTAFRVDKEIADKILKKDFLFIRERVSNFRSTTDFFLFVLRWYLKYKIY